MSNDSCDFFPHLLSTSCDALPITTSKNEMIRNEQQKNGFDVIARTTERMSIAFIFAQAFTNSDLLSYGLESDYYTDNSIVSFLENEVF